MTEEQELEELEKEIAELEDPRKDEKPEGGVFDGMMELCEINAHQPVKLPGKGFQPRNRIVNNLNTGDFAQYSKLKFYAGDKFAVVHDPTIEEEGESDVVLIPYANIRYVVPKK